MAKPDATIFCLSTMVFFLVIAVWPSFALAWQGVVVRVTDGDSLTVRRGSHTVKVRLYGIDAPEYHQRFSLVARAALRRQCQGRLVEIERMDRDEYGREVALVRYRDLLLNEEMVRSGHAWVFVRYCSAEPLCSRWRNLEQAARRERRGLWRDAAPLPPWDWRSSSRR